MTSDSEDIEMPSESEEEVINEEPVNPEHINIGDFLLIKFEKNKTKKAGSSKFIFPIVEDKASVDVRDVVLQLPKPTFSKGTSRTSSLYSFSSLELGDQIYNSCWYDLPVSQQKMLLIMMTRAQKPFVLNCGFICDANCSTFVQSLELGDQIYNSCWYDLPVSQQKMLLIMMTRAQKPFVLNCGFICDANCSTFVQSLELGDQIYNSCWYDLPVSQQKMLLIMMTRAQKPFVLNCGFICDANCSTFVQSLELGDQIYNSCWYDLPVSQQKMLLIMMTRAQKPFVLNCGFICGANCSTYVQTMKSVYSFLNAIINLS
ncbi:hypothetical protein HHI36_020659 [Cryptolaemus montrouzieri]|uniref:Uncharacterized protein n=1 Tax=Cryptolaemus montrouzieri TaxID=559131 RepID=A0ABD2NAY6_9CUCU